MCISCTCISVYSDITCISVFAALLEVHVNLQRMLFAIYIKFYFVGIISVLINFFKKLKNWYVQCRVKDMNGLL